MNNFFLREAIKEAMISYKLDEIPVGAIIIKENKIISSGHNLKHTTNLSTNHAEIQAINKACLNLNSWYLKNTSIYITLEPCIMCAGAILESRIKNIFIGTPNPYKGFFSSNYHKNFPNINLFWLNNKLCEYLIYRFFRKKRTG